MLILTVMVVRWDGGARGHMLDENGACAAILCEGFLEVEAPLVEPSFSRHFMVLRFSFLCTAVWDEWAVDEVDFGGSPEATTSVVSAAARDLYILLGSCLALMDLMRDEVIRSTSNSYS